MFPSRRDTRATIMFDDVESYDKDLSGRLRDVTIKGKTNLTIGTKPIRVCPVGQQVWVHEQSFEDDNHLKRISVDGKEIKHIKSIFPQDMYLDKTNNVYLCFADTGWISRLTPDHRVVNIVNTGTMRPISICVTQSGDILSALVDVSIQDFEECKQTYIARMDSMGKEKQRIQFEEDGHTRLFQYGYFVDENKNGDIVVLNKVGEKRGQLIILDQKGYAKHYYNGTSQLDEDDFLPATVCCDNQCRIIVADKYNSALHLLNPRGELLRLLMTEKDGLVRPYSLGLSDGLLWVGTYEGKVIVAEYKAFRYTHLLISALPISFGLSSDLLNFIVLLSCILHQSDINYVVTVLILKRGFRYVNVSQFIHVSVP